MKIPVSRFVQACRLSSKLGALLALAMVATLIVVPFSTKTGATRHTQTKGRMARGSVQSATIQHTLPTQAGKTHLAVNYGKLPMVFEANEGQTNGKVKFMARGKGYSLFLTGNEAVMSLRSNQAQNLNSTTPASLHHAKPAPTQTATLRMKFLGSNEHVRVTGTEELPGKNNYYIGNNPKKWRTNVSTYAAVKYENLYPGVDLVYYGSNRQLEYDLIVAPGADPSTISMAVDGADDATLDTTDDVTLDLHTGGKVLLKKPVIYQDFHGVRKEIAGHYRVKTRLNREGSPRPPNSFQIGFELASYDPSLPLVIDPPLNYATFLGGGSFDAALAIAADSAGNAYVTGLTGSTDFPVSSGTAPGGGDDSFVTKLNPTGTATVFSTYLGGNATEEAYGITLDSSNNVFLTGDTYSTDFPGATGGDSVNGEAFVTKLDSTGAVAFTKLLGVGFGQSLKVDSSGNVYVIGNTGSTTFPIVNGFQTTCSSCVATSENDSFVAKLNPAGDTILYSSFLGGDATDNGRSIALTSDGKMWVIGSTDSSDFPTTVDAPFQTDPDSGAFSDAFVAEIDPTLSGASSLLFSTYLGDISTDFGTGIAVDGTGNVFVAGLTDFAHAPTGIPGFQTTNAGGMDVFVAKIDTSLLAYVYSTLLGGTADEGSANIVLDSAGRAFVTGSTNSTDFPVVNAVDGTFNASAKSDAFVTEIAPDGLSLVFSTYVGGEGNDAGQSVAVNGSGNIYVAGTTDSADFPASTGALQTACGDTGGCTEFVGDGFVASYGTAVTGGPQVDLSPTSLDFGNQIVGSASAASTITLHNTGTATLNISGISVSGTNASAFSQTNTCGATVAADATCSISVTFTPSDTGSFAAAVTIESDASSSPDTATLAGSGVDFTISAGSGSSTSATVTAGASATYTMSILGTTGVTGTANLSCTGAPTASTCTVSPTSVALSDTTPAAFTVTVTTTAPAIVAPGTFNAPPAGMLQFNPVQVFSFLAMLAMAGLVIAKGRRARWLLAPTLLLAMVWTGCGSSAPKGKTGGTPAGTYTLTITASTSAGNKTTALTLSVN